MPRLFRYLALALLLGCSVALVPDQPRLSTATPRPAPVVEKGNHKDYTEKIPFTKISFEMAAIPGGVFSMGSPADEEGRQADEGPQHKAVIRPFWMGKCEVTWDEFDEWWMYSGNPMPLQRAGPLDGDTDATTQPSPPYIDETYGHGREHHPALCMTHFAAMKYCEWLSRKTGRTYRLPTEAEWEYACRAESGAAFSFGNLAAIDEYAWHRKNSADKEHPNGTTHEVGSKKPNAWGLHDMHGNVAEWCLDEYRKDAYATFAKQELSLWPVLIPPKTRYAHVARGGSWADAPDRLRSAARRASDKSWQKDDPGMPKSVWWLVRMDVIGFRVVRPVEEQENLRGFRPQIALDSD
jgi:formylglycine-generating enzyme required for sulfatase activity